MTHPGKSWLTWLETHWVAPAYGGGVLMGLTIAFFGAAVNTMSGWLYTISGLLLAVLAIGAWFPPRSIKGIQVHRSPIRPISVGEPLSVQIQLHNATPQPRALLQGWDRVPPALGPTPTTAIAAIAPQGHHSWTYTCRPTRRGIYRWDTLTLRTAAPLGLFWCQRSLRSPAHATVYPQILPLARCPLIDQLGVALGVRWHLSHQAQQASEGLTRALRPYRWGDPTRLIHWRTSARYGELRVRELEQLSADNQVLISLDTRDRWSDEAFEAAVITAASLYIYSLHRQLAVGLWLSHTGILQNKHGVLSALAEVMPGMGNRGDRFPAQPMIWLSPGGPPPQPLPSGSLWVRWIDARVPESLETPLRPTLSIHPPYTLLEQLQSDLPLASLSR